MSDTRGAILRGRREAARLHREFGMRERIEQDGGRIDVFDTIVRCGVPLVFKPLDGLLGVFIDAPMPGVMVTTKRGLSVQRFTGAHELGHCRLRHSPSLDDESILRRVPFSAAPDIKQQELEADAFATEFMLPPWLFAAQFKRQGWTPAMMADPAVVYQLSLRIGASYEATCRSLMRPGVQVINRRTVDALLESQPRAIKKSILGEYTPPDFFRDVWVLTEKDQNAVIEGSRSDLFVLKLTEHSGAGYVWTFDELNEAGFAVVRDEREDEDSVGVGGNVTRLITTLSEGQQNGRMVLAERRPWIPDGAPLTALSLHYDLTGPESEGLSQAERRHLLEAA
jgi:Zn-dependent peptidase ImmA (M78 family)/predicted secreted protein